MSNKSNAASLLGALGGKSKSKAKRQASIDNLKAARAKRWKKQGETSESEK